jgi:NADPH2 dehydrogenase
LQVADAVHAKGCFLFMQLWALSPGDEEQQLQSEGSAVFLAGRSRPPHDLTVPEIKMYTELYAQAAKNAIVAGCDGVEFDGA